MFNFVDLETSWVALGERLGVILGCFGGAPGGKQEFVENLDF